MIWNTARDLRAALGPIAYRNGQPAPHRVGPAVFYQRRVYGVGLLGVMLVRRDKRLGLFTNPRFAAQFMFGSFS